MSLSIVDTDNNNTPAASIADIGNMSASPDWQETVSLLADTKEAIAPIVGFFKSEKTSPAPTSKDVEAGNSAPAPEPDKKGKGKHRGGKRHRGGRKKGEKFVLEVREDAGEASGEKGGEKGGKTGEKDEGTDDQDDQLAKIASQLVKGFEAKYGAGAELTEERLKELLAGDSKITLVVTPEPAPTAHDAEAGSTKKAEVVAPADDSTRYMNRKERIESLVLSQIDKPKEFDRSSVARFDLGTATPSEVIVESVRQANLGEFRGTVAAVIALEDQETEITCALARARKAKLAASLEAGRRVGWEKVMRDRQEKWKAQPLEVKQAEVDRRRVAEEQLAFERRLLRVQKRAERFAKAKAAGKKFVWDYGGKALELGATVALHALLKKLGTPEPEKVVRAVFGLGKALQQVTGIEQEVEGAGSGGDSDEDEDNLC
ncbi:hypothetical protein CALVIDRAFT_527361 [Calocera viscosa TUFC12733]|uniref:Uncharacterized protein n=1 Tax=Calocera viscosa (strain TUFC12733) TaxID=1330018 RepID=A0A167MG20_CALVF|nr:hypothetical protein CALVIDRAFT_527361 [Calocera viscosa TUFC12733]